MVEFDTVASYEVCVCIQTVTFSGLCNKFLFVTKTWTCFHSVIQEPSVPLLCFHWSPSVWNEIFRGNFVCKYLHKLSFWPEYISKYKPSWKRRKCLAGHKLCKGEVRPSHSIYFWCLKWKDNLAHLLLDGNGNIKRHLEEIKWASNELVMR